MKTCYIFAIGGTGARVMTSLTHLLATGSEYDRLGEWRFVPIIIDLDTGNGNLVDCIDTLKEYRTVHKYLKTDENYYRFFRYPIENLKEVTGSNKLKDTFLLSNQRTVPGNNLEGLIDYPRLNNQVQGTQDLVNLLYTQQDRQMPLDKGFKGKPPIGAVFFEQLADLTAPGEALNAFEQRFNPDNDRIFIISSIFGGTGAAGFPWLTKFLRRTGAAVGNLQNAKIAALSVQPYFTVNSDAKSEIDSNSFITKTKSALKYYSKHLQGNLNAIYYIGDNHSPMQLKNSEGGSNQKNRTSPIELIGATAILDFLIRPNNDLIFEDPNLADNRKSFGYSTHLENDNVIYWKNIQDGQDNENSERQMLLPLLHFHVSSIMIRQMLRKTYNINWGRVKGAELFEINQEKSSWTKRIWDRSFLYGNFYKPLYSYMERFTLWLDDLKKQESNNTALAFHPLQVHPNVGEVNGQFKGIMNGIIERKKLTEGVDILINLQQQGNTTHFTYGKNLVTFQELITSMNKVSSSIKNIQHTDKETENAQRLMFMIYTASLELLKQQASNSFNVKSILT